LKTVLWGLGLQLTLGYFVSALRSQQNLQLLGGRSQLSSSAFPTQARLRLGDLGRPKELSRLGFSFRLPGASHHHVHPRFLRRALYIGVTAAHHPRGRVADDRVMGA